MNILGNLFQFLGMVITLSAAVFAIWYYWLTPGDSRRARNTATLLTTLFVVILCPYLFHENTEYEKRIAEYNVKLEKDKKELEQITIRIKIVNDSLDRKNRDYKDLLTDYEKFRNKSVIDQVYLLAYLQRLSAEVRIIQNATFGAKTKIARLRKGCENELLDSTRWDNMQELLKLLGQKSFFSFFDQGASITQLKGQIEQIRQFTKFLITELDLLEKESSFLEDRLIELYTSISNSYGEKTGKTKPTFLAPSL